MSIEAIASAVPQHRETAAEIARQTGVDEAFITDKVGIQFRHILGPDETGIDLAEKACWRLFAITELKPESIGALIFVTQTPDHPIPHNSALLAARLRLPLRCAAFDIGLGCSGYVYALSIAEGFLAINKLEHALLVTCDPYSKIIAAENRATNAVFGDGATATWLRRTGTRTKLGICDFGTDGANGKAIIVPAGGAKSPFVSLQQEATLAYDRDELRLHMLGRDVFNFVMTRIPDSIHKCIAENELSFDAIDWFALHQGSRYMLFAMAEKVGITRDKLPVNIDRYGNTVSSSIPMLLEELMQTADLKGSKIVVSGFGVGLSWATNILSFEY